RGGSLPIDRPYQQPFRFHQPDRDPDLAKMDGAELGIQPGRGLLPQSFLYARGKQLRLFQGVLKCATESRTGWEQRSGRTRSGTAVIAAVSFPCTALSHTSASAQ